MNYIDMRIILRSSLITEWEKTRERGVNQWEILEEKILNPKSKQNINILFTKLNDWKNLSKAYIKSLQQIQMEERNTHKVLLII